MIQKVALHSPANEFCPEVIDLQAGRHVLSEEFNLFSLPEVHASSTDKTLFPLVKTVPELVVASLERKAPSRRHPTDKGLFSTVVECVYNLFGDVSSIKHPWLQRALKKASLFRSFPIIVKKVVPQRRDAIGTSLNILDAKDFCFRKDFHCRRKPGIIPSNFIKTVSCGVV